ncbi:MAG: methyl-accepting chemotaxis protein [Fibromonadales bacterium]|nr:methyl-accepting chemotaxis protein [Fibromonadales bacterium]
MKNIKIGPKLTVSFLFIAALTAFIGIFLTNSLKHVNENGKVVYEKAVIPLELLVQTADIAQEIRLQARELRLAETEEARATALKSIDEANITLRELVNLQKDRVVVEAGRKPLDEVIAIADKYVEEVHRYGRSSLGSDLRKAVSASIAFKTNTVKEVEEKNEAVAQQATGTAKAIIPITVIISILIGIFLTSSITRPLSIVVDAISKIENGDMTIRLGLERGDELGTLSKAMDNLSARLQTIFSDLRQNSDTLAGSAEELSSIGRQVTNTTEQVTVNISAMASGAAAASTNANEVAGTAEQMSTNMNTMAVAVEELSASINQIANNAVAANKIASKAAVKSREATEAMNKLGTAAKEIGHVTDVIKRIAEKTNLLALNATIEAASAGAAGKGFAVVAGEIKELANQSAKSADDITRRIEGIQSGTSEAVTVIGDVSEIIAQINHSVEVISNHVDQQTKASNEIASNVAQVNIGAKRVASAIGEVARGSKDMSRNVEEVAKGSISAQNTKQINQGADELAKLASSIKSVLNNFEI